MDSKNGLFLNINNVCLFWASTYSISESEILCMASVPGYECFSDFYLIFHCIIHLNIDIALFYQLASAGSYLLLRYRNLQRTPGKR